MDYPFEAWDELAAMVEEWALESQWRQMQADCYMVDREAFLREMEPSFDPWGDFDWKVDL